MRRLPVLILAALLATTTANAQRHRAANTEAAQLTVLFAAADRGDDGPLRRALTGTRNATIRTLIQARLAAMWLDPAVLGDARLLRLAAPEQPAGTRRSALSILTSAAFAQGRYAEAARTGAALLRLQRMAGDTEAAAETAQTLGISRLLAAEPAPAVERRTDGGAAPAHRDKVGLTRVALSIDGQAQDAVFDTGANLSVLSAATARRLGVRVLSGDASVGNSVQGNVAVRIAIADRVEIGGAVLRHVAFLVIDDAALTFPVPGGYDIPAILGFPEMRALGRLRMERDRLVVEQPQGAAAGSGNLRAVENSLVVDARVGGIAVPLHLDSGANPTHLNPAFAAAHPQVVAGLSRESRRLAGAGGASTGQAVRWRDVAVEVAGGATRLPDLLVDLSADAAKPSSWLGVIGADLLGRFESYTLDLKAMRLELGPPVAAAPSRG